jgi:extracellular factor (EF) 3-hydroxypalmitic acid methyl ester biosynthesis protein
MEQNELTFNGFLISEKDKVPVQVACASKYSIYVKFDNNYKPVNGSEYSQLMLKIEEQDFEFGPCRIIFESNPNGYIGRLVFLTDIFDFNNLFFEKKLINLQVLSKNLALILLQKEKVKDEFKNYISNLSYDLKVYKHFFDDLDQKFANEPAEVKTAIFQVIVNTLGGKFLNYYQEKMNELERLAAGYNNEEHKLHGFYLRKQMWDVIMCSEFMSRTNIKPRGYAGDSEMMRMIYENIYTGDTTFGKILNNYGLNVAAAQSVRNRRLMIPKILRKVYKEFSIPNNEIFRFMSVACGPAYELSDLFISVDDAKNFQCTLLDQDTEALEEAMGNIHNIEKVLNHEIQVVKLNDSVRTMLRTPDIHKMWGRFHLIYSMGLFDYLTQPVAKAVIESIYSMLEPGGTMLVGNYHVQNFSRFFMEYWLDWVLYYRTEKDMTDLLCDTNAEAVSVFFEEAGCQVFLLAKKPL